VTIYLSHDFNNKINILDIMGIRVVKAQIRKDLENKEYIESPILPSLTFKPDFLIDHNGKLVFVRVYNFRYYVNMHWKILIIMEEIFEIKLGYGYDAIYKLFILNINKWPDYTRDLLNGFSDSVLYEYKKGDVFEDIKLNSENINLWRVEKKYSDRRYYKRDDENFIENLLYDDITVEEAKSHFNIRLNSSNIPYDREFYLYNIKNYFIPEQNYLYFVFDYKINNTLVDFVNIERTTLKSIQNLLIKARLSRYRISDNKIYLNRNIKLILFLEGNISGPSYDRYRYIKLLYKAGWTIIPPSYALDREFVMEEIINERS